MRQRSFAARWGAALVAVFTALLFAADAQVIPEELRASVDSAVARVKPALVRIEVVSTYYTEGREQKYESSGSGAIISKEGHVITNHHVAGRATRLVCTLSTREKIEAELVGRDALTDLAVIKLLPEEPREFPVAVFGDSSLMKVGDTVLAMGSPMSLSQSVTLGIVSNAELVLPEWMQQWGALTMDGEDVGTLVRWIAHDADIYGGNSGGPLVNLQGEIIGINEIRIGLAGAIPGNLAKQVAEELMANGQVRRAWLGIRVQPRLRHNDHGAGVLIGSVVKEGPASKAGIKPGDLLTRLAGHDVDVQFAEQLPAFNQLAANMPIDEPVEAVVLRDGEQLTLSVTPEQREEALPEEHELKQWGITVRNISLLMAKELKRDSRDGVLITSVRPGGPANNAKPSIDSNMVIVKVGDTPVRSVEELRKVTDTLTEGKTSPTPVIVSYENKRQQYITVVQVGIKQLEDPGREVEKAWLPVETQVLTRDIAKQLGDESLDGFRITEVYPDSSADKAGLKVGDFILKVDGESLEASAPEDADKLAEWIRQYRIGDTVELLILREGDRKTIPVELKGAPKLSREMKKYEDTSFEFMARDITFFDRAEERWAESQQGVLIHEVKSGGWAALGLLSEGDFLMEVAGDPIANVDALKAKMEQIAQEMPKAVVFKVLRGIHTMFLEIEPRWESAQTAERSNS